MQDELYVTFDGSSILQLREKITESDWNIVDRSSSHFFLSRQWLNCWFSSTPADVKCSIVRVFQKADSRQLGFCIFGMSEKRSVFGRKTVWSLFKTGNPTYDQIWIEYNAVLTLERHDDVSKAMWRAVSQRKDVQEIEIGVSFLPSHFDGWLCEATEEVAPYANLPMRTKSSLRKKLSHIDKLSPLIREHHHVDAVSTLIEASRWHIDKWDGTNTPSGFSNPFFVDFHRSILLNSDPSHQTRPRIFSLWLNGENIAVLYGFQANTWFGFYCLCQDPKLNNKLRAGLFFHDALQKKLQEEGVAIYDFMAGDAAYKRELSSEFKLAYQYRLQKPTLINVFRRQIRNLACLIFK